MEDGIGIHEGSSPVPVESEGANQKVGEASPVQADTGDTVTTAVKAPPSQDQDNSQQLEDLKRQVDVALTLLEQGRILESDVFESLKSALKTVETAKTERSQELRNFLEIVFSSEEHDEDLDKKNKRVFEKTDTFNTEDIVVSEAVKTFQDLLPRLPVLSNESIGQSSIPYDFSPDFDKIIGGLTMLLNTLKAGSTTLRNLSNTVIEDARTHLGILSKVQKIGKVSLAAIPGMQKSIATLNGYLLNNQIGNSAHFTQVLESFVKELVAIHGQSAEELGKIKAEKQTRRKMLVLQYLNSLAAIKYAEHILSEFKDQPNEAHAALSTLYTNVTTLDKQYGKRLKHFTNELGFQLKQLMGSLGKKTSITHETGALIAKALHLFEKFQTESVKPSDVLELCVIIASLPKLPKLEPFQKSAQITLDELEKLLKNAKFSVQRDPEAVKTVTKKYKPAAETLAKTMAVYPGVYPFAEILKHVGNYMKIKQSSPEVIKKYPAKPEESKDLYDTAQREYLMSQLCKNGTCSELIQAVIDNTINEPNKVATYMRARILNTNGVQSGNGPTLGSVLQSLTHENADAVVENASLMYTKGIRGSSEGTDYEIMDDALSKLGYSEAIDFINQYKGRWEPVDASDLLGDLGRDAQEMIDFPIQEVIENSGRYPTNSNVRSDAQGSKQTTSTGGPLDGVGQGTYDPTSSRIGAPAAPGGVVASTSQAWQPVTVQYNPSANGPTPSYVKFEQPAMGAPSTGAQVCESSCFNNIRQSFKVTFNKDILKKAMEAVVKFKTKVASVETAIIAELVTRAANVKQHLAIAAERIKDNKNLYDASVEEVFIHQHAYFTKSVERDIQRYTQLHFDFVSKTLGKKLRYIARARVILPAEVVNTVASELREFDNQLASIANGAQDFLKNKYPSSFNSLIQMFDLSVLHDVEDQNVYAERAARSVVQMGIVGDKITSFYYNKITLMDIIFDSQFMVLYVIKALSFVFLLSSFYLSEKLFSEMYMKTVYAESKDPPNINIFWAITMVIHLGFVLFLTVVLFLLMFLFKTPNNMFVINGYLLKNFFIDYASVLVLSTLLAVIVGSIIQKKRYFRYKTEGLRGIRALREILTFICLIVFSIPFFHLFS